MLSLSLSLSLLFARPRHVCFASSTSRRRLSFIMVRAALPLLAALAGSAVAAETTTVKILVLGDESPFVGSVVNVDSSATTFAVQCPSGTPSDECGLPPGGATITQGESTWQWSLGMSNSEMGVLYVDYFLPFFCVFFSFCSPTQEKNRETDWVSAPKKPTASLTRPRMSPPARSNSPRARR